MNDTLRCHVPRSEWIEKLRGANACDVRLLEVPLPFPGESDRWDPITEDLRRAESRYRDGDYHGCVSACRYCWRTIDLLDEGGAARDLAPGGPCPFLGREAWVSAEGRFDPCCAPDAERRTLGEFGNLDERNLMDIWRGDAYRTLAATYHNRALCLGCNMRRPAGSTS